MSFEKYFARQLKIHPSMRYADAIKLCYQAAFGAEHLLSDKERARAHLYAELEAVTPTDEPLFEQISDELCRVNLGAWKREELPSVALFEIFVSSAVPREDGALAFESNLAAAQRVMEREMPDFDAREWQKFLEEYRTAKMPPIHHSDDYRGRENPHYRVVAYKCFKTEGEMNMTKKLFIQALLKFTLGILLVGALVFLPAGTVDFAGGWLLMGILFIPMLLAGVVMMIKSPSLLESRLDAKEKEKEQSIVVKLSGLMFLLGFVLAGLDFRFGWIELPFAVNIVASVVFFIAYILYAEVLRENAYLSRTVKVVEGQKVISTGLYAIVRHPMYFATVLLFLAIPLVLGSIISFAVFLAYPFIIAKRIKNEEEVLSRELDGYEEYKKKVKYRMIPFIW